MKTDEKLDRPTEATGDGDRATLASTLAFGIVLGGSTIMGHVLWTSGPVTQDSIPWYFGIVAVSLAVAFVVRPSARGVRFFINGGAFTGPDLPS